MLTKTRKILLEFLVDEGLKKEDILDVSSMLETDEDIIHTLNMLKSDYRRGIKITRKSALLATIRERKCDTSVYDS